MDTKTILLDVGGTYIKCTDGRQIPANSDGDRVAIASALRKAIGPAKGLKGIGVAIPGPFDYNEGYITVAVAGGAGAGRHNLFAKGGKVVDFDKIAVLDDVNSVHSHDDYLTVLRQAPVL